MVFNLHRKRILQDTVKYSDFTTEKFLEIHARMRAAVDAIKPLEEYKDFIAKHRYYYIIYIIVISSLHSFSYFVIIINK